MFYWWPVHWYWWLVEAVGECPLMWTINGLALAIWGSRHAANAFMRTRISDRRVTKWTDTGICYTRLMIIKYFRVLLRKHYCVICASFENYEYQYLKNQKYYFRKESLFGIHIDTFIQKKNIHTYKRSKWKTEIMYRGYLLARVLCKI